VTLSGCEQPGYFSGALITCHSQRIFFVVGKNSLKIVCNSVSFPGEFVELEYLVNLG